MKCLIPVVSTKTLYLVICETFLRTESDTKTDVLPLSFQLSIPSLHPHLLFRQFPLFATMTGLSKYPGYRNDFINT